MALRLLHSGSRRRYRTLGAEGVALANVADRVRNVVARRLGPSQADILAIPRPAADGDRVDWHTTLPGAIVPLPQAAPGERAAALAALGGARDQFQALAAELGRGQGDELAYARQIGVALEHPGEDHVFIVGGRPVVTFWGFAPLADAPETGITAPPPLPPRPVPPAPVPPAPAPARGSRRWAAAPLALLPLLLLAYCAGPDLGTRVACLLPAGGRAPSRLVVLLDTSGSMLLPLNADARALYDLAKRSMAGDRRARSELNAAMESTPREESRLHGARVAVERLVQGLPAQTQVGLVTFGTCGGARSRGPFPAEARPSLVELVRAIEPENGTPLAAGLQAAAQMLRGESAPVVALISDGEESCGGDPCAMAQALAEANPSLVVNVVDLSGLGVAACVAEATGGKVFAAADLAGLTETAGRAADPAGCP